MTTNITPKQTSDTELVAQQSSIEDGLTTNGSSLDVDSLDENLSDDEQASDYEEINDDEDQDEYASSIAGQVLPQVIDITHTVTEKEAGLRIDKLASQVFTDFSRVQLQGWVGDGSLLYNGSVQKPKQRVKAGDVIHLSTTLQQHSEDQPENIAIDVVYEDDDVLVIDKPVGMVVHPGAGNQTGTLVNALLYHYPQQHHLPRAGLVHRIDKDTSGLLLIGK
ncbi:pseudouridine synthase, partial [Psychrobacter sp. 1U2]